LNIKETVCDNVYWIHLALDRFHWQVLTNTVMNIWVS